MKPLLTRGDAVTLLDESGQPKVAIEIAGAAGFSVKGRVGTRWWADRGKTWSSEKLDRQDEVNGRFQNGADQGGKRGE